MTLIEDGSMPADNVTEIQPKAKARKSQAVAIHEAPAVAASPLDVINRAIAQGISGESLKQLMDLQERWETANARKAFDAAIAGAKGEIPVIIKTRRVSYDTEKGGNKGKVEYDHEDLAGIATVVDPILKKYGLAYRYRTDMLDGGRIRVTCIVSHEAGGKEETSLESSRDSSGSKNDLQAMGSAITYLQRYTLKAALGLAAAKDDDARTSEPPTTITAIQLRELDALAAEVKADVPKFCKFFKIEEMAALPAKDFDRAKQMMDAKRSPL